MTVELAPQAPKSLLSLRPKTVLFALIGVMYVLVFVTTESFLFDKSNPEWAHIAPFQLWLLPHGIAAACALFLGPFQFSERLRRKYLTVHKTMGYLYIAGCYVGAPLGLYIQWIEEKLGTFSHSFTIGRFRISSIRLPMYSDAISAHTSAADVVNSCGPGWMP